MSTKNYVSPKCNDVLLSLESPILAGSSVGVSIDDFSCKKQVFNQQF